MSKRYSGKSEKDSGTMKKAGLCGTLCVSEISPGGKIIFNNICPTFSNYNEMLEIINKYLKNSNELINKTEIFCKKSSISTRSSTKNFKNH